MVRGHQGARELVVVVHGASRRLLNHVTPKVQEHLPNADVLLPIYTCNPLSNTDPVDLADELSSLIQQTYDQHKLETGEPYQRLILIGHSRGALLLRKG